MKLTDIKQRALIALLLVAPATQMVAQSASITAKLDSSVIWMGEQTAIKLDITQQADKYAILALPTDTITQNVEIIGISKGDTTNLKNNTISIKKEIVITSFDSGFYQIPPIVYIVSDDTFKTQPLNLKVVPVSVDTTKMEIRDIKGAQSPKFVLTDFIPVWIWYTLLSLLLIAAGAYLYLKYRKESTITEQELEDITPPYEVAISKLSKLKEAKLWQSGEEKRYYTHITDILREYIDRRFGINAMEMTSEEILNALRKNSETSVVERHMKSILEVADFVKFAKMRPIADDNEASMRYAINFVEETKPQPEVVEENKLNETKNNN